MRFSIITPSFNQSAYLPECVESVRGQWAADAVSGSSFLVPGLGNSGFSIEHLVQDGGSTDGTVGWLGEYTENVKQHVPGSWFLVSGLGEKSESPNQEPGTKNQEPPYRFAYVSEKDAGQTEAINKGLARATGDVLSYLCADDYLMPGALARVAAIFAAHPEVDVVYGDYAFLEGDSGWVRRKRVGSFSVERLRQDNFISQPATFWRRRVYESFGGFDESLRFCMDHEYWLRIAGSTAWFYIPEMLAVQRLHGDSKTGSQLVEAWEETALMAGRYGLGELFERKVKALRLYGAAYYALRRRVFRFIGRWMR